MSQQPFSPRALAAALLLTVPLLAQRTWVVDQNNGPGTDFTSLQAAFTAAADGDTLLLRAGTYIQSSTNKGFVVIGQGRPMLVQLTVLLPQARSRFVLTGCDLISTVQLHTCVGLVHLEDVTSPANLSLSGCRLLLTDCAGVTLQRCRVRGQGGSPAVLCTRSTLAITASDITGTSASANPLFPGTAQPALWLRSGGSVHVTGGTLSGGNGAVGATTFPPVEAIRFDTGAMAVGGDGTTVVQAGTLTGSAASAITGAEGTLLLDPTVTLVPSGGAPPFAGAAVVTTRRHPALTGAGAPPGGAATAVTYAPAGQLAVLFGSLPAAPVPIAGFGTSWLDAGTLAFLASTVMNASEHWSVSLPVPLGVPPGLPFSFQVLTVAGASQVELSNGMVLVLN